MLQVPQSRVVEYPIWHGLKSHTYQQARLFGRISKPRKQFLIFSQTHPMLIYFGVLMATLRLSTRNKYAHVICSQIVSLSPVETVPTAVCCFALLIEVGKTTVPETWEMLNGNEDHRKCGEEDTQEEASFKPQIHGGITEQLWTVVRYGYTCWNMFKF